MASNEDKLRIIDSVMNNLSIIAEKKRELNLGNNEIRDLFTALVQSSVDIIDNKAPALPAPQETVIEGTATAVVSTVEKKEKEELPLGHPDYYASQYRKIGSILRGLGVVDDAEKQAKFNMFSFYTSHWRVLKGNIPQQKEFCRVYAKEIIEVNEEFNNASKSGADLAKFSENKLAIIQEKHKTIRNSKKPEEAAKSFEKIDSEPGSSDQPWPDDADIAAAAAAQPAVAVKKAAAKNNSESE